MAQAQATVVRAFGLGTGAWALWVDLDRKKARIRHYDARMVIPLISSPRASELVYR